MVAILKVLLVFVLTDLERAVSSSLRPDMGALAGVAGATGLITFYTTLSIGRMGIAAPVSALLTAGLPVLFSAFTEGLPSFLQLGGFVLALLAIWLISRPEQAQGRPEGVGLALLSGCAFGCFFILISRLHSTATFWPLTYESV